MHKLQSFYLMAAAIFAALGATSCGTSTHGGAAGASGAPSSSTGSPGSGAGASGASGTRSGSTAGSGGSGAEASGATRGGNGSGASADSCPSTVPAAGACSGPLNCAYSVDGKLLPSRTPCGYRDAACFGGQWVFSHNDPGASQCGWFPGLSDAGYPDECTPSGGTCIDPHTQACPAGSNAAQSLPCGPWPVSYCCLPSTRTLGQGCIDDAECDNLFCWGPPLPAIRTVPALPRGHGLCTKVCSSSTECGAGLACVDREPCRLNDAGMCGHCLPLCNDAGSCANGSCQSRTTVEGVAESACDPCVPPSSSAGGDGGTTCVLNMAP